MYKQVADIIEKLQHVMHHHEKLGTYCGQSGNSMNIQRTAIKSGVHIIVASGSSPFTFVDIFPDLDYIRVYFILCLTLYLTLYLVPYLALPYFVPYPISHLTLYLTSPCT